MYLVGINVSDSIIVYLVGINCDYIIVYLVGINFSDFAILVLFISTTNLILVGTIFSLKMG